MRNNLRINHEPTPASMALSLIIGRYRRHSAIIHIHRTAQNGRRLDRESPLRFRARVHGANTTRTRLALIAWRLSWRAVKHKAPTDIPVKPLRYRSMRRPGDGVCWDGGDISSA